MTKYTVDIAQLKASLKGSYGLNGACNGFCVTARFKF